MKPQRARVVVWLSGEVRTLPFLAAARLEAGWLLRRLQQGEPVSMPHARPMRAIAPQCHELRIKDEGANWRVVHRLDDDAVVILAVFEKKARATPKRVIEECRRRLARYEAECD